MYPVPQLEPGVDGGENERYLLSSAGRRISKDSSRNRVWLWAVQRRFTSLWKLKCRAEALKLTELQQLRSSSAVPGPLFAPRRVPLQGARIHPATPGGPAAEGAAGTSRHVPQNSAQLDPLSKKFKRPVETHCHLLDWSAKYRAGFRRAAPVPFSRDFNLWPLFSFRSLPPPLLETCSRRSRCSA